MKVFQVSERYVSALSNHDEVYLLAAESESHALEAAEEIIGARKPGVFSVGLTLVEVFDQQRLERLEQRLSLLEKKAEEIGAAVQPTRLFDRIAAHCRFHRAFAR